MEFGNEEILSEIASWHYLWAQESALLFLASKHTSFQDRIWNMDLRCRYSHWYGVTTWVMEAIEKTPVSEAIETVRAVGQER